MLRSLDSKKVTACIPDEEMIISSYSGPSSAQEKAISHDGLPLDYCDGFLMDLLVYNPGLIVLHKHNCVEKVRI